MPKSFVLAISVCILAGWVYFNWQDSGTDPKIAQTKEFLQSFDKALENFRSDVGAYPKPRVGLKALLEKPMELQTWKGPYLKQLKDKDLWGNPVKYGLEGESYVLRSAGPDKVFGSKDDLLIKSKGI